MGENVKEDYPESPHMPNNHR